MNKERKQEKALLFFNVKGRGYVMKAVAYCRVSTSKEEQLDSMESQQNFFMEYAKRNGYDLVKIYADEGKSGTKLKNRTELLKLLKDAATGSFEVVLIKDISRLARNTVDFLTSIRKLKALNIRVIFVNYDQTSSDSSEFMLTMLSAIAQEESANTSKRVRFGKLQNARKGRVPNLVYGYDKTAGDYFHLKINETEALVVKRIFQLYTEKGLGAGRIAAILNQEGIKTKRGCKFTQNGICRILSNEIYTGKVINGKQEITDFLTGRRKNKPADTWMITYNPELKIVSEEVFEKAGEIRKIRGAKLLGACKMQKHLLSQTVKCRDCGAFFRRLVRTYKNTYITWVCNGRNRKGADYCKNTTAIEEDILLDAIRSYFIKLWEQNSAVLHQFFMDDMRKRKRKNISKSKEKEWAALLEMKQKQKQKYIDMYLGDILTMEELTVIIRQINKDISRLKSALEAIQTQKDYAVSSMNFERLFNNRDLTGLIFNRLIDRIEVDHNGVVDVFLKSGKDKGKDKI